MPYYLHMKERVLYKAEPAPPTERAFAIEILCTFVIAAPRRLAVFVNAACAYRELE